jgi:hypothetical protein
MLLIIRLKYHAIIKAVSKQEGYKPGFPKNATVTQNE